MPVFKRKYRSGKTVWRYMFNAPGSTREERRWIEKVGFATKQEAKDAEAKRYLEEQQKYELARAGSPVAAAPPGTLATLLDEFIRQHAEKKLAPKTVERYREQAAYLDPSLLAMPLAEIKPLHLSREWSRLLESGGHTRRDKKPRPMSVKTVRNIAGVVSAAFGRGIKWELVTTNPVPHSEPPVPNKRIKMALVPSEQQLLAAAACGPWCLETFLDVATDTGARRGEVLALRWSDIRAGYVIIERSLTQTKQGLAFKSTKTGRSRCVELPPSTLAKLEAHRERQDKFRQQFGSAYRADLDLIFANTDGTPLKPDSISGTVSRMCRQLRLPKGASLHVLRHSHASLLLDNGTDLATVSERLGHSSVRVTADTYAHAIRGRDRKAADSWDELMGRTSVDQTQGRVN
jgi:integrase